MKKFTAFHLKVIAIVAMLVNHIGHTFEREFNPLWWETTYLAIGRLTFPIMAYLVVEGFYYTRNRWRYAGRLGLFSLLAFVPFHYVFLPPFPLWPGNNIMFTLMMGVFMMMLCERLKHPIIQGCLLYVFMLLTYVSDWNVFGVLIIFAYYKSHRHPQARQWVLVGSSLLMLFLSQNPHWVQELIVTLGMLMVIPLLENYNGERGYSPAWVKWGFYLFYPLHLVCLWGIRYLIFGY